MALGLELASYLYQKSLILHFLKSLQLRGVTWQLVVRVLQLNQLERINKPNESWN